jgi:hypothetical protein
MKNPIFLTEALDEMIAAAQFYETQSPGLGQDFLSHASQAPSRLLARTL